MLGDFELLWSFRDNLEMLCDGVEMFLDDVNVLFRGHPFHIYRMKNKHCRYLYLLLHKNFSLFYISFTSIFELL